MKNSVYEPLTGEQVKQLCAVIHCSDKSVEEKNHAKTVLAFSHGNDVHAECKKIVKRMHCNEYYNDEQEEQLHNLEHICFEVLMQKAESYNPNLGTSLFTFASHEIKNRILQETNKGMTSTEIRQYNRICGAKNYYEEKYNTKWYETEDSLNKLSEITGYSVKLIKKTLAAKRETNIETVSIYSPLNNEDDSILENILGNCCYSYETEYRNREAILFIESLSKEEKDILYTMVDVDNNYKLISEREGVRLLKEKKYSIGRGTLNTRREALKRKVYAFLHDPDYIIAA